MVHYSIIKNLSHLDWSQFIKMLDLSKLFFEKNETSTDNNVCLFALHPMKYNILSNNKSSFLVDHYNPMQEKAKAF